MAPRIWQVDAFTAHPFAGNPAAVCLLDTPADDTWMQALAAEMNLSETAFVRPVAGGFDLRWFTPQVEVDLCGHATLATAHVLWSEGLLPPGQAARFHTKSGLLGAALGEGGWIELDFPAEPASPAPAPPSLVAALGARPLAVAKNRLDYLVEVATPGEVAALDPDMALLKQVACRGVMVTSQGGGPEVDFVSRFFAPAVGVAEDPVTGSAHCCLGPYWRSRLGKDALNAYQASARGGHLRVRVLGQRVGIAGQAVTVFRGELA
ncbi:MAG: PhzF family phenazine biosynthesis protein [Desulfarculus sp.]|nr:PhzF family phenazine biosynthesis protein [Desulfarculus sp.]